MSRTKRGSAKRSDIIVIGGGASGMTAAIAAARAGALVTILEHGARVGKKILSTGNGRCNLTNLDQSPNNYRGSRPEFALGALRQFSVADTLRFFGELGIHTKNRNGYLYPKSDQASAVLDVLRMELSRLGVLVECEVDIKGIVLTGDGFAVKTDKGTRDCKKLILAAGSKAAPKTGSDGSGYALAKTLGHHIITPAPALVQLMAEGDFFKSLAGVRTDAQVTLCIDNHIAHSEAGELQLTATGISGIVVFQISRFASRALLAKKRVEAILNFLPDFDKESWDSFLAQRIRHNGYKTMEEFFIGLFHKKLIPVLLKKAAIKRERCADSLSDYEWTLLWEAIHSFTVKITAANSFDNAQVCCGGVDTREINECTMESRKIPGLFFAGEIMDVDGACGGYNLQWAWSSGFVAGSCAAGSGVTYVGRG